MKSKKLDITKTVLKAIAAEELISLDRASLAWWQNFRNNGGFRLTAEGYDIFKNNFDSYAIKIENPHLITSRVLLQLDKKLDYPYYLAKNRKTLYLFGSKEAMTIVMYGDVVMYLKNLQK